MENLRMSKDSPSYCETTETLNYWQSYSTEPTNGHYSFKLNQNKGPICNVFVQAAIAYTTDVGTPTLTPNGKYLGAQLLKSTVLKTDDSIICSSSPIYLYEKVDSAQGSSLGTRLKNSLETVAFTTTAGPAFIPKTMVYNIPVIFFFNRERPFDVLNRPQLYLEIQEAGSKAAMGFQTDFTSVVISYKLFVRYLVYKSPIEKVPKALKITNSFIEKPVPCVTGSTSTRLLLKCPYKTFRIASLLKQINLWGIVKCDRVTLSCPTGIIFDLYSENNYICADSTDVDGYQEGYVFNIKIGKKLSDHFITFNEDMYPCYLTVYHSAIPANYNLEVYCEYRNDVNSNTQTITKAIFT